LSSKDEQLLTVNEVKAYYPAGTHSRTIVKHMRSGVKTPSGYVKLEAYRMGGRWTTTTEAITRFRARLTAQCGVANSIPDRDKRHARAMEELKLMGM